MCSDCIIQLTFYCEVYDLWLLDSDRIQPKIKQFIFDHFILIKFLYQSSHSMYEANVMVRMLSLMMMMMTTMIAVIMDNSIENSTIFAMAK